MDNKHHLSAWMHEDLGCKECGYPIVVTQSEGYDYFWYCSNKYCKNHTGEETYDMDRPEWIDEYD